MPGKIFINYRREDEPGYTLALFPRLEKEFSRAALFMDVEGYIKAGDDFVRVLDGQVAECDVMLVMIGPGWIDATDEQGRRRLDNRDDFVRVEIASALKRSKRVIPVLVNGAQVPRAETLPDDLQSLARRNAVRLSHDRFSADCEGLVKELEIALAEAAATHAASATEADAARRRQHEETARAEARAGDRARHAALAGLSPEDVVKAEELANWDFIKASKSAQEFRDHLARFPAGVTARYARERLEALIWQGLGAAPGLEAINGFIAEFPDGANAEVARALRQKLENEAANARLLAERQHLETEAWAIASAGDIRAVRAFLMEWPSGQHAAGAQARITELRRGPLYRRAIVVVGLAGLLVGLAVAWWTNLVSEYYRWYAVMGPSALDRGYERLLRPKDEFKECSKGCPEMVVVPAGRFKMGTSSDEIARLRVKYPEYPEWFYLETPQHEVTFAKPFAVSKFEVTFDDWEPCVASGACTPKFDNGWGEGRHPVIFLSWLEAQQYVAWLARMSGRPYRLLSEAEWEYTARAGSTAAYWWGDEIEKGDANCKDCGSQWGGKQSAPVGSFRPNAFGLHDMHGNVWEWVQDCWHDSYKGAPSDGSAWISDCTDNRRVVRGGAWGDIARSIRAAVRSGDHVRYVNYGLGFRVARSLNQ